MLTGRLQREYQTVEAMIGLYCRGRHPGAPRAGRLCAECEDLRRYAELRIVKCPFGDDKPTCAKCVVHCYKPDAREHIRRVMRYAGPRMLFRHPVRTFWHYWDEWTRRPQPLKRAETCAPDPAAPPPGSPR
jgi:hypothetical protein